MNAKRAQSPTRLPLAVAGLAVAALALSACGGSDSDGPDASKGDATSWSAIQDEGVITVGTEGTYSPFSFHEGGSGDLAGYDVEVTRAVAEELGIEVEFEETQWDAMFAGLDAGRFDVIANQVTVTAEREAAYELSDPYTVSNGVVVVNKGDSTIRSLDDLAGKTTAQSLTSNWNEMAKEAGANVEGVEGWAQAVALLKQGRVDATINDKLTFLDYVNTEGDTSIEVAVETDEQSESAFTFRKGSDVVEQFNTALATLREDGTLAEISEKYFGEDVSG